MDGIPTKETTRGSLNSPPKGRPQARPGPGGDAQQPLPHPAAPDLGESQTQPPGARHCWRGARATVCEEPLTEEATPTVQLTNPGVRLRRDMGRGGRVLVAARLVPMPAQRYRHRAEGGRRAEKGGSPLRKLGGRGARQEDHLKTSCPGRRWSGPIQSVPRGSGKGISVTGGTKSRIPMPPRGPYGTKKPCPRPRSTLGGSKRIHPNPRPPE